MWWILLLNLLPALSFEILYNSIPQRHVIAVNEYQYFQYTIASHDIVPMLLIQLIPCSGDPNLYVTAENEKQGVPTLTYFSFYSSRLFSEIDTVHVYSASGTYTIGVHAMQESSFEIIATNYYEYVSPPSILTQRIQQRTYQLNITHVTRRTIQVSFNVIEAGKYTLYAFPSTESNQHYTRVCGVELGNYEKRKHVVVQPAELKALDPGCSVMKYSHVPIYGTRRISLDGLKESDYIFSLVFQPEVKSESSVAYVPVRCPIHDVRPIQLNAYWPSKGQVGSKKYIYFKIDIPRKVEQLRFQLISNEGDADLYIHSTALPTFTLYEYGVATPGEDVVYVPTEYGQLATSYFIAIYGYKASSFELRIDSAENSPLHNLEFSDQNEPEDTGGKTHWIDLLIRALGLLTDLIVDLD